MKKIINRLKLQREVTRVSAIRTLLETGQIWKKNEWQRLEMTVKCRDTDYIPKVRNAGQVLKTAQGREVQIMHNGLKMVYGGYHGEWMGEIIKKLNGHHEPQEEKAFYEVLKRLGKKTDTTIIELGSFWSYYSLWFLKNSEAATAIACEPDPNNIKIGIANAKINQLDKRIQFIDAAAGNIDGKTVDFTLDSDVSKKINSTIRTVDSLVEEKNIDKIGILHLDVQGVELEALKGALGSIKASKVRFVFVSTHHYFFSGDPLTHKKCADFIEENGGHIITSHNVLESFSGDGLIVASFDEKDNNFIIKTELNHSTDSLFRSYEEDISILLDAYDGTQEKK